jgi:hypothetical protein
MPITYNVAFAVYGAIRDENTSAAVDVTQTLQALLNNSGSGVVTINNENMGGDPAPNIVKSFGALVSVGGGPLTAWACNEGQTIDFS